MIVTLGNRVLLGPHCVGSSAIFESDIQIEGPGAKNDFVRALVETLDGCGYHNLAFAIARTVNDPSFCDSKRKELNELVELAKKFLQDGLYKAS